jgi:hypothetical protein
MRDIFAAIGVISTLYFSNKFVDWLHDRSMKRIRKARKEKRAEVSK